MAILPLRLQRILFARLDRYNCVSKMHPRDLQRYGGVAICSGGSYKSLHDWCYMPASLFKADLAYSMTKHPLILQVSDAPHCSLANGPYLRTTSAFNGFPVYAQINQHELTKQENGFQNCIESHRLLRLLNSTAPNLSDKQLRAGERLLVRQQNAWIVQSVTAYRGFSAQSGACGFYILRIPDGKRENASCFAGLGLGMKHMYEQCSAHLAPLQIDPVDMKVGSSLTFDFGSRRVVRPSFIKGIHYKPSATRFQEFHGDGPHEHDATSIWTKDGKVDLQSDACLLSRLETLSVEELQTLCTSRKLEHNKPQKELVKCLHEWLDMQPKTPIPVLDSMFQSLSALFAFYPNTALGVPCSVGERCSRTWKSLKLNIPLGTAVIFRFDFFHHGWSCVDAEDSQALPVHFRAHFYLYSGHLPSMPLYNFEAALEFLSATSHDVLDDATGILLMECLQTFVPYEKPHEVGNYSLTPVQELVEKRNYKLFRTQQELDDHCRNQASVCEYTTICAKLT